MERSRHGFTRVELFVVIVVIGILLGLLLPELERSHGVPRRIQCMSQLKQLGLAAIQYENAKGELPGFVMDFGTWHAGENPVDPSDLDADTGSMMSHRKIGTWAVALLPYLDGQPTYEHWTHDRYPIVLGGSENNPLSSGAGGRGFLSFAAPNLYIMQCPADPMDDGSHGRNSYICNAGMYSRGPTGEGSWAIVRDDATTTTIDFARSMSLANGVFNNQFAGLGDDNQPAALGPRVTLNDFTDGMGMTMLFSESLQAMPWHRAGFIDATDLVLTDNAEVRFVESSRYTQGMVWHYEDAELSDGAAPVKPVHRINGTTGGVDLFSLQMNEQNAAALARPSSAHVEGVNVAMADGGTRFIYDSIDYRVYQALLTPCGKQSDIPERSYVWVE